MKLGIIMLISFFFLQSCVSNSCIENNKKISSLDSVHESGTFRVFYSMNPNSPDYLVNSKDMNKNDIPDIVEDILIQANTTSDALRYLGFIHPLESNRYKSKAKFIDIHLITMQGNGNAGENAVLHKEMKNKKNKCALVINIRNSIDFPGNYWTIVNHELFHLYQYGYTQFKGGWYLEGMTNSMERIFKRGHQGGLNKGEILLPSNQLELENNVYKISYNELWARLAVLSDHSDGQLKLPLDILDRRYIDGTKVFKDENLKGYLIFKRILENMGEISDEISKKNKWDKYHWKESDQIDPVNRKDMLSAIQQAMIEFGLDKTSEQKAFLKLH
ncbi:hypothetical protein EC844_1416 [Acinetobacter calcoaceticus]|uniref:Peptidase MA superfamily protein n=1 Tax=Acinetobacter calcoaceticus TaxID=471 RepID=A0A4R1X9E7_ACICA|nr:hypothetical protein EC844_1416 [Acinetobacter calcoaceticus]